MIGDLCDLLLSHEVIDMHLLVFSLKNNGVEVAPALLTSEEGGGEGSNARGVVECPDHLAVHFVAGPEMVAFSHVSVICCVLVVVNH